MISRGVFVFAQGPGSDLRLAILYAWIRADRRGIRTSTLTSNVQVATIRAMHVPVILPVVAVGLLWRYHYRITGELREACVRTGLTTWLLTVVITETLSLCGALSLLPLCAAWALTGLVAHLATTKINLPPREPPVRLRIRWVDLVGLVPVAFILSITLVTAVLYPPNTWDSMTYHMSRVMHWIQQQSVDLYPTTILRQLYSNPLAEYGILHTVILAGSDRLANLIQWTSMLGSVVLASLLARQLGASRSGQWAAAVSVATLPMGILQASSTQNDYVAGFFLLAAIYYPLRWRQKQGLDHVRIAGIAIGLGILAKGTMYFYYAPFAFWFAISWFRNLGWSAWKPTLGLVLIVAVINGPYWVRNTRAFGTPLGPAGEAATHPQLSLANESHSLPVTLSNLARNTGIHLGTGNEHLDQAAHRAIVAFHAWLNLDLHDPRSTWLGASFGVYKKPPHEDLMGCPAHAWFGLLAMALMLCGRRFTTDQRIYVVCLCGGAILFSLMLRWQTWHSRLHLPLFLVLSVLAAFFVRGVGKYGVLLFFATALLGSYEPLIKNKLRPFSAANLASTFDYRMHWYFMAQPRLREGYEAAAAYALKRGASEVGIATGLDDWEYPFWLYLKNGKSTPVITHVLVENDSSRYADRPAPDLILATRAGLPERVQCGNRWYHADRKIHPVTIYLPVRE